MEAAGTARWLDLRGPMRCLFGLFAILASLSAMAQSQVTQDGSRIEIIGADAWTFDGGVAGGAQRLIGHARFKHAGATMACDSAYIFEDQRVQAFGRVAIRQGDTLTITGDRLDYSGRERLATITGSVRLSDRDMELTTGLLTYDLRARTAVYVGGGTIVSRKEGNTLTSERGTYLAGQRKFIFSGDVMLQGPDRSITSDTLHYTTTTGVAEFFGPTSITSGATRMWCRRGTYDTRRDVAHFTRRAKVLNEGQELHGVSLHYEKASGIGEAFGHVMVLDTA
jgi:lipopolysaccharide export system protein LptA